MIQDDTFHKYTAQPQFRIGVFKRLLTSLLQLKSSVANDSNLTQFRCLRKSGIAHQGVFAPSRLSDAKLEGPHSTGGNPAAVAVPGRSMQPVLLPPATRLQRVIQGALELPPCRKAS